MRDQAGRASQLLRFFISSTAQLRIKSLVPLFFLAGLVRQIMAISADKLILARWQMQSSKTPILLSEHQIASLFLNFLNLLALSCYRSGNFDTTILTIFQILHLFVSKIVPV
ncbi:MAG: hypothetical protein ISS70_19695 [Phycisphaerae bacterium]|nr:hypothetical protein [Phycisphaerae bacterium]